MLDECKNVAIFVSADDFYTYSLRTSFKLFTVSCKYSVTWLIDCYSCDLADSLFVHMFIERISLFYDIRLKIKGLLLPVPLTNSLFT